MKEGSIEAWEEGGQGRGMEGRRGDGKKEGMVEGRVGRRAGQRDGKKEG